MRCPICGGLRRERRISHSGGSGRCRTAAAEFDADSRALLARIGEILGAYDLSQQSRQLSWVQQQLEQGAQRILQESAHEKRMYAALGPLLGMALCILIG